MKAGWVTALAAARAGEGGCSRVARRFRRFAAATATVLLAAAVPSVAGAHAPGIVLQGYGTAKVDGVLAPGEWAAAGQRSFVVSSPWGDREAHVYVMNNRRRLFMAVNIAVPTVSWSRVGVSFDSNNDGLATPGIDDAVQVDHGVASMTDALHHDDEYFCGTTEFKYCFDTQDGGTNDEEGAAASDGLTATFELSKPLVGDAHDFNAQPGTTLGFQIGYDVFDSARIRPYLTFWPGVWYTNFGAFGDITIAPPASQSITFGSLPTRSYAAADFSPTATASSGLAVSFRASGSCKVNGANVHITAAGSCTITASQPGDDYYEPAADISQTFAIVKANQRITFPTLANKTVGATDFRLRASASSRLAVSFAARGRCRVSGSKLHITGAGSCTVTASQPGNANYRPAPKVLRTFAIAKR